MFASLWALFFIGSVKVAEPLISPDASTPTTTTAATTSSALYHVIAAGYETSRVNDQHIWLNNELLSYIIEVPIYKQARPSLPNNVKTHQTDVSTVRRLCVLCGNKNTEAFTRNLDDIRQKTQTYLRLRGRRLSPGHLSLQLAPPPA